MAWVERTDLRGLRSRTYQDTADPNQRVLSVRLAPLHYEATIDSGVYDAAIDATPVRVDNPQFDGWRITAAGWHYALGKDLENHGDVDGWIGFGGRQGAHWFKFRLLRVGYLHWPTRAWQDIGGAPIYDRADLSRETSTLTVGPNDDQVAVESGAAWRNIWITPGGGEVAVSWWANGERLKEEVTVNQAARTWVEANAPPETPASETWFGFVYRLDWSGVPKVLRDGVEQDTDGDFADDGEAIELRDATDRLLAFMPIGAVWTSDFEISAPLRKRFYRDGSDYYLAVGVRCGTLAGLPDGDLVFDPTENMQVSASSDDAEDADGTVTLTGPYLRLYQGSDCYLGWRFVPGTSIPQGATVSNADFQFRFDHANFDTINNRPLYGEDGANPGTFTESSSDIANRTATTASVNVNLVDVGTDWQLVEVDSILEELVGDYTVQAVVLILHDSTGSDAARITAYDGDSANCGKLDVTYTTGAFPPVPGRVHRDRRWPLVRM